MYRFDRCLFDFWHDNWISSRWTLMKIGLNVGRLWLWLVHSRESGNRLTWKRKLVGENYLFYSAVRKCRTHTTVHIVRKTQHKWGAGFLPMPQCGGGMHCPSIRLHSSGGDQDARRDVQSEIFRVTPRQWPSVPLLPVTFCPENTATARFTGRCPTSRIGPVSYIRISLCYFYFRWKGICCLQIYNRLI